MSTQAAATAAQPASATRATSSTASASSAPLMLLPAVVYIVALVGFPLVLAIALQPSATSPSATRHRSGSASATSADVVTTGPSARPWRTRFLFTLASQVAGARPRQHPGAGPLGRLRGQPPGPLPHPAALDDPDRPRRHRLALAPRQRLQPDRRRAPRARPARPGHPLRPGPEHALAGPAADRPSSRSCSSTSGGPCRWRPSSSWPG